MLELYKKRANKTQYVKKRNAFHKIYLHHQALDLKLPWKFREALLKKQIIWFQKVI